MTFFDEISCLYFSPSRYPHPDGNVCRSNRYLRCSAARAIDKASAGFCRTHGVRTPRPAQGLLQSPNRPPTSASQWSAQYTPIDRPKRHSSLSPPWTWYHQGNDITMPDDQGRTDISSGLVSAPLEYDEASATNTISATPHEEGNLLDRMECSDDIRGGLRGCEGGTADWKKAAAIDKQDKGNRSSNSNGGECQWEDSPVSPFASCRGTTSIYSTAEVGGPTVPSCVLTSEQRGTSNATANRLRQCRGLKRGAESGKHAAPSAHTRSIAPEIDDSDELPVSIASNTSTSQELVCD